MRPDPSSPALPRAALRDTLAYGLRVVWSTGSRHVLAMAGGALLAAVLAPVSILVLGLLISEINTVISTGATSSRSLDLWILIVAGAAFAGVILSTAQQYAKLRLKDALTLALQQQILSHAAQLDAGVLDDRHCQNILERANQNPGQKVLDLLDGLIQSVSGTLQVVTLAGVLLWIEPWWTLGLVAAVFPMFVASFWLSRIAHDYHRLRTAQRRWTHYYARMLTHREWAQTIKVLRLPLLMMERHERQMQQLLADNRRLDRLRMSVRFVTSLILLGVIGGALAFAARRAAAGELNVGMFTAFWMAAWRFRDSAGKVGGSLSSILDARLAIANLQEFFALHPRMMTAGTLTPPIRGAVTLRNVSFRYTDQSVPVLENITLDLHPGEIVALVGPNGAGKSTLAKLIARLYAPTDGDILIDGTPLEAIRLDHYYRHLALVPQTPPRFEATAGENIAFGNWDELQQAPDRIRQIAAMAGADRLIQQLPDGLDTMLGRMFGDHDLSGGQWKKLSLARALAGDPRIVILDEPAANLDIQTERLMHQQLKQVLAGRTTILISHHFSSVLMADRIVVLVDGRLVEQGTHAELQAAGGVYASMCQTHRELTQEPSGPDTPSPSMPPRPGGTPPSGQQAA